MSTELTKEEMILAELLANQLISDAHKAINNRRKRDAKKV